MVTKYLKAQRRNQDTPPSGAAGFVFAVICALAAMALLAAVLISFGGALERT